MNIILVLNANEVVYGQMVSGELGVAPVAQHAIAKFTLRCF